MSFKIVVGNIFPATMQVYGVFEFINISPSTVISVDGNEISMRGGKRVVITKFSFSGSGTKSLKELEKI